MFLVSPVDSWPPYSIRSFADGEFNGLRLHESNSLNADRRKLLLHAQRAQQSLRFHLVH